MVDRRISSTETYKGYQLDLEYTYYPWHCTRGHRSCLVSRDGISFMVCKSKKEAKDLIDNTNMDYFFRNRPVKITGGSKFVKQSTSKRGGVSHPRTLVGRKAYITDPDSIYSGEWGIITAEHPEDDEYFVAIAAGTDSIPMFSRSEFKLYK